MDKARKRLRICLICVVMTAVAAGLLYYYYEVQENGTMNKGTLISNVEMGMKRLCQ